MMTFKMGLTLKSKKKLSADRRTGNERATKLPPKWELTNKLGPL